MRKKTAYNFHSCSLLIYASFFSSWTNFPLSVKQRHIPKHSSYYLTSNWNIHIFLNLQININRLAFISQVQHGKSIFLNQNIKILNKRVAIVKENTFRKLLKWDYNSQSIALPAELYKICAIMSNSYNSRNTRKGNTASSIQSHGTYTEPLECCRFLHYVQTCDHFSWSIYGYACFEV